MASKSAQYVCPKDLGPDAQTLLFRAQGEELLRRAPPFLVVGTIILVCVTVLEIFLPLPGQEWVKLYLVVSGGLSALATGCAFLFLTRTQPQLRHAQWMLLGMSIVVAHFVSGHSLVGNTLGVLVGVGALLLILFARTIASPMSGRHAFVTSAILWLVFPLPLLLGRFVTGGWVGLPELPFWVAFDLSLIAGSSVVISGVGAHALWGLRQTRAQAARARRYELGEQLGAGAMGEVYAAVHGTLKHMCAVKICTSAGFSDHEARARFQREARRVSHLQHPNIVRVFDYGELDDGRLFFAMEYLPGVDLKTLLDQHGPLRPDRLVFLADQVAGALSNAHRSGLVHRDLKPGNLMVSQLGGEPDVIKVLDFGLVKIVEEPVEEALTQAGSTAGTPWYMAPEQIERAADSIDARADLYALGAVLWHLAAGQPVFSGETPMSVLVKHVGTPAPRVDEHAQVSAELADLIAELLSKKPDDRPQSAEVVRTRLRSCPEWGSWTREDALAWWGQNDPVNDPSADPSTLETLATQPMARTPVQ